MFSGIIKDVGTVDKIDHQLSNLVVSIKSALSKETHIDQSISHNGVCLTVVKKADHSHTVVVVRESLKRTNFNQIQEGDLVNLEKSVSMSTLLDGHLLQGHVDCTGTCREIIEAEGSWMFGFEYSPQFSHLIVDKGSIGINGVSLTVVEPGEDLFWVSIIPYTFHHTNFRSLNRGEQVNLEFDIIGKYVARKMEGYGNKKSHMS